MDGFERFPKTKEQGSSICDESSTDRFIIAQENSYQDALEEIKSGRKRGHWIWYVFPQLKGLGHSYNSEYYGIADTKEAEAYLAHPILGERLREITKALLELPDGMTARNVLGGIDAMKVKSCMTLFYTISKEQLFLDVLNRFYEGKLDERTTNKLK